ncbi:MAG: spore germination protein [Clostridia bacterium]
MPMTYDLDENVEQILQTIGHNPDVICRDLVLAQTNIRATILYIKYLINKDTLNNAVLKPLLEYPFPRELQPEEIPDLLLMRVLQLGDIRVASTHDECVDGILSGNALLFVEGNNVCILLAINAAESRNITEPITESVVRGSREGFVENLETNLTLLRKQVKNPALTIVNYKIGRQTRRNLVVVYLRNIANPSLIEEVKQRIERIDIDDALESGFIEQLIEDDHWSPFPQVQNTERPDKVISAMLEGRVAILLDGTPFSLLVPVTFNMLLQSVDDYTERWYAATLIRIMRYGIIFLALFLPALYIALVSYHQGLIPTKLAISMTASREGVPFPTLIEALIMEVTIEILREAGIRLPKPIGQAVGIVGGLVIGQSAVQAGIVSPIMVIVVAVTAISSFAIPQYSGAIALRLLRFGLMFAAALLGLYGVVLAFLLICGHMVSLKSFGVNYMGIFVMLKLGDLKDSIVKVPYFMMKTRPLLLKPLNKKRMSRNGEKKS